MKWGRQPNAADKVSAEKLSRKRKASTASAWVTGDAELRIGFVIVGIILFLALLSIFYTPYDVYEMNTAVRSQAPSAEHFFGTDNFGRDVFSRAMTGARFTLLVSGSTVLMATAISIVLGLVCGYVGGMLDEVVMRVIDAINSFPSILIALVMVSILNYGKLTIIPALVIMFIPSFTRIVRTGTLQYKNAEFVMSNKVFGDSDFRILFVHILPNIYPLLLSSVVIGLSNAILAESSMSYLGLGIQPPIPSWGRMLKEAQDIIFSTPWAAIAPGMMIVFTIVGLNCIGEGIRKKYLS
ncbi:MAG: ABC transporter permease [Lachnospiraceae bacterium]|nr:ABC transporter permease [Lachnospiraceae bacterium]